AALVTVSRCPTKTGAPAPGAADAMTPAASANADAGRRGRRELWMTWIPRLGFDERTAELISVRRQRA
ncbi:MAG: hypothetical protein ACRDGR_07330, partial [bacterium]